MTEETYELTNVKYDNIIKILRDQFKDDLGDGVAIEVITSDGIEAVLEDCLTIGSDYTVNDLEDKDLSIYRVEFSSDYYQDEFENEEDEVVKPVFRIYLKLNKDELDLVIKSEV